MLESRNLFVDTQVFKQQNFHFDQITLKHLQTLGASGAMHIVLTESVVGEVKAHLKDQLSEAVQVLKEFRKLVGPLNGHLYDIFKGIPPRPNKDEFVNNGLQAWATYLENAKAVVLPASSIDSGELLGRYFDAKPPFGPGAKKDEFPDAISALSLEAWLKSSQERIYVVSQDHDLERWCFLNTNAIHVKTLAEFFELFNRSEVELTELAHKLFTNEVAWITDLIKAQFINSGFLYADNWDAEVEDVSVKNISIIEVNLIEVEDEAATFGVVVQIEFSASINGPDYDNGYWDKEDGAYAYLPDFHIHQTFNETYGVSVEIIFDAEKEELEEVSGINFDVGSDITLRIDDGYPWK